MWSDHHGKTPGHHKLKLEGKWSIHNDTVTDLLFFDVCLAALAFVPNCKSHCLRLRFGRFANPNCPIACVAGRAFDRYVIS